MTFWIALSGAFTAFTFVPILLIVTIALYFSYVSPIAHGETGGWVACIFTNRFLHERLYRRVSDGGPAVLVLGNSRQFFMSAEIVQEVPGGPPFFNFSIHNGEPLELSHQYRYLVRAHGFRPKVVLLGVNYDMFFRAVRADRLFLFSPWFNPSLLFHKISAGAAPNLLPYLSLTRGLSVRSWHQGVKGCGEVIQADGSVRFVEIERDGSVDERLIAYKREFYKGSLDDGQFDAFWGLAHAIIASGSALIIVDSPQSPRLRDMRDASAPGQYSRYRHFLESLCARTQCGYLSVEDLGERDMTDAHFHDGVHLNALGRSVLVPRLTREAARALIKKEALGTATE